MKTTNVVKNKRPDPEQDGVTHINIYSSGKTELGKMLSHFYQAPFKHPVFGPFNCMEGFWHWVKSKEQLDDFRRLSGWPAKKLGKTMTKQYLKNFPEIIMTANYYKIDQHPDIKKALMDSTLPFEHYYLFGDHSVVIQPDNSDWLVIGFDKLRTMFRNGEQPEPINYDQILSIMKEN